MSEEQSLAAGSNADDDSWHRALDRDTGANAGARAAGSDEGTSGTGGDAARAQSNRNANAANRAGADSGANAGNLNYTDSSADAGRGGDTQFSADSMQAPVSGDRKGADATAPKGTEVRAGASTQGTDGQDSGRAAAATGREPGAGSRPGTQSTDNTRDGAARAMEDTSIAAASTDNLGTAGASSNTAGSMRQGTRDADTQQLTTQDTGSQAGPPEEVVVGMVDAPGKKATSTEINIPQTLGGMLPLTLGVEGEGEFDFDKAVVRDQVKSVLDELAGKLQTAEYDRLDIVGHTDRIGNEQYNQYLSERRAWAVARYLVKQGVPVTKLNVVGRGMQEPISKPQECSSNLSRDQMILCLQKDRRVVISASIRKATVDVR